MPDLTLSHYTPDDQRFARNGARWWQGSVTPQDASDADAAMVRLKGLAGYGLLDFTMLAPPGYQAADLPTVTLVAEPESGTTIDVATLVASSPTARSAGVTGKQVFTAGVNLAEHATVTPATAYYLRVQYGGAQDAGRLDALTLRLMARLSGSSLGGAGSNGGRAVAPVTIPMAGVNIPAQTSNAYTYITLTGPVAQETGDIITAVAANRQDFTLAAGSYLLSLHARAPSPPEGFTPELHIFNVAAASEPIANSSAEYLPETGRANFLFIAPLHLETATQLRFRMTQDNYQAGGSDMAGANTGAMVGISLLIQPVGGIQGIQGPQGEKGDKGDPGSGGGGLDQAAVDARVVALRPNEFTTAEKSKLGDIEARADVTDRANVYAQLRAALVAGANVTLTDNDSAMTVSIAASGGGGTTINIPAWTSGLNPAVGDLVRHGSTNTLFMCIQAVPTGSRNSGPDGLPNNYLQINAFIGDWTDGWFQPGSLTLRQVGSETSKRVYVSLAAISRGQGAPESNSRWARVDGGGGLSQSQVDARVAAGVADWAEQGNAAAIPAGKLSNAPGLNQSQVDARVAAGVADWAEQGNTSAIPSSKLTNAPAGGGGLNQGQVDARVTAVGVTKDEKPWKDIFIHPTTIAGDAASLSGNFYLTIEDKLTSKTANRVEVQLTGTRVALFLQSDSNFRDLFGAMNAAGAGTTFRFSLIRTVRDNLATAFGSRYAVDLDIIITFTDASTYREKHALIADAARFAAGSGLTQTQVDARVRALIDDWAETGNATAIPAAKLGLAPRPEPRVLTSPYTLQAIERKLNIVTQDNSNRRHLFSEIRIGSLSATAITFRDGFGNNARTVTVALNPTTRVLTISASSGTTIAEVWAE